MSVDEGEQGLRLKCWKSSRVGCIAAEYASSRRPLNPGHLKSPGRIVGTNLAELKGQPHPPKGRMLTDGPWSPQQEQWALSNRDDGHHHLGDALDVQDFRRRASETEVLGSRRRSKA